MFQRRVLRTTLCPPRRMKTGLPGRDGVQFVGSRHPPFGEEDSCHAGEVHDPLARRGRRGRGPHHREHVCDARHSARPGLQHAEPGHEQVVVRVEEAGQRAARRAGATAVRGPASGRSSASGPDRQDPAARRPRPHGRAAPARRRPTATAIGRVTTRARSPSWSLRWFSSRRRTEVSVRRLQHLGDRVPGDVAELHRPPCTWPQLGHVRCSDRSCRPLLRPSRPLRHLGGELSLCTSSPQRSQYQATASVNGGSPFNRTCTSSPSGMIRDGVRAGR